MAALPLHPQIVHLPIALSVLLPLVSAGVLLAWWRGWLTRRSWILIAAAQALLVASAFVALRTGEAEEERVEASGVPEAALEAHEEAAERFLQIGGATFVILVVPLFLRGRTVPLVVAGVGVVATVGVLVACIEVGERGGDLVYRHGAGRVSVAGAVNGSGVALPGRRHDEDDDD